MCSDVFSREHLIRLQHENKMLKLAQEGSDNEKIALLQSLLEDANRRRNELETENRSGGRVAGGVGETYQLQPDHVVMLEGANRSTRGTGIFQHISRRADDCLLLTGPQPF